MAGGFSDTYKAYSNLRGTEAKKEVIQYVRDLGNRNVVDLDLSVCPGVEMSKSTLTFDIITIGYALQHNTYFKGLIVRDVNNREAAAAIACALVGNRTLRRVSVSRTQGEVPQLLGEALAGTRDNSLMIVDLSESQCNDRMAPAFCAALRGAMHIIKVIDLSNAGLSARSVGGIVHAFRINWGMSLGLEELSLSGNQMDAQTGRLFTEVIIPLAVSS